MRILVHGSQLLYPTDTGGRIRTAGLFEQLSRQHDITWVCLRRPEESDSQVAAMSACCSRIETFPFVDAAKFSPRFYRQLAGNIFSRYPFVVAKYFQPRARARIAQLLAEEHFDLLLCDFLQPSLNVLDLPFAPRVLFQHNVESVIFERHCHERGPGPARAYLRLQWRKLRAYEAHAARWFDRCIMVSENDRQTMARLYQANNTAVIPTGVDADYYRPIGDESPANELVFTGSMDWLPNLDGLRFFAGEILPRLRQAGVPVKLWVVGRRPLPAVQALAAKHPEITVTGTVDDVRPYIARARLYVVPLRVGSGTRMKIFEAMAMGKAVLSTRIGAEGLPVSDGRDIVLADEPEAFAREIIDLLADRARCARLGQAARRLVSERFAWEVVARRFGQICEQVVEGRAAAAARASVTRRGAQGHRGPVTVPG